MSLTTIFKAKFGSIQGKILIKVTKILKPGCELQGGNAPDPDNKTGGEVKRLSDFGITVRADALTLSTRYLK